MAGVLLRVCAAAAVLAGFGLSTACNSTSDLPIGSEYTPSETITINEGDVLKISFATAKGLDTTQEVRRDGRISLAIVGEVVAAGLTPGQLANELANLYAAELVSKEVTVTVVSSSFEVVVSGAVLRPGKVLSKRPLTAFEAVMEAGGFDNAKADMKRVVVVRREGSSVRNYTLNLAEVLDRRTGQAFFLKPFDIVFVPNRVNWF